MSMVSLPIPKELRTLERDARGYPIPWIILRDRSGRPHFAANDSRVVADLIRRKRCAITGRPLKGEYWFIGGPKSMLHEHGVFLDGPMLHVAAVYALQICPYLAMPRYVKSLAKATTARADFGPDISLVNPTLDPARPPLFGLGLCHSFEIVRGTRLKPERPWKHVEWWRDGKPDAITPDEREAAVN